MSVSINPSLEQFRVSREVPVINHFKCKCGRTITRANLGWYQWGLKIYLRYSCECGIITSPPTARVTTIDLTEEIL